MDACAGTSFPTKAAEIRIATKPGLRVRPCAGNACTLVAHDQAGGDTGFSQRERLHADGFVFAAVYFGLKRRSAFSRGVRGGLIYGTGVFVAGSLPVYFLSFASFQVSLEIIFTWVAQSFAQYALAGMALGLVCDGATVQARTILPGTAYRVWKLLLLKDSFLYFTGGLMSYTDTDQWPKRLFTEGKSLKTRVKVFGLAPSSAHHVQVVRVDEARGEIETNESGGLVRVWNHRMRVEPVSETTCRYTDRIELEAGILTPLVWLFAVLLYRYRQRRWQQWLTTCSEQATAHDDR